mmetsp:Transcript_28981/g.92423  ORF Transcript_28981/g.92423 Transcript_28981/m.92423 type:complete len:224 (-) Transcript_28981:353-1024(-)
MVEEEPMPALEISELMSLMEDLPGHHALNAPSLLESPSSPHSTITEDISIFGGAEFEGSYMDLPPPEDGAPDSPLIVSLSEHTVKPARGASRKRSHDDGPTSVMTEDDARKAQRMARNRRAAATSRARKKEHLESLQSQVDRLQAENAELRRRLKDAGLMSDELEEQLGRRPYGLQPAVGIPPADAPAGLHARARAASPSPASISLADLDDSLNLPPLGVVSA